MLDIVKIEEIRGDFVGLLQSLSGILPESDIEYIREEIGHAEYGDALENLVALLNSARVMVSEEQRKVMKRIALDMGMSEDGLHQLST